MPSFYVSEARVLVGVQLPRLPNVESLIADVSPDAERVQNEGFILQSRNIARQVIDQLRLRDDPEFNPNLRKPSFWSRLNPQQYLPSAVDGLDRATDVGQAEGCRCRQVYGFLHRPWRSHQRRPDDRHPALPRRRLDARPLACAERQGGVAKSRHCRRHRQRPRRAISRLSAPRQDRVDGQGRQVPARPGRRTARAGDQVGPGGRGLSPKPRPLQERRKRRHCPAAQ